MSDTLTAADVIRTVREYLDAHQPKSFRLLVDESAVWLDADWWNVVVKPDRMDVRALEYATQLSEAEEAISDRHNLKLLLVPALAAGD